MIGIRGRLLLASLVIGERQHALYLAGRFKPGTAGAVKATKLASDAAALARAEAIAR